MPTSFSKIFCKEEGFFRFDQSQLQSDRGCLPAIALAQARRAGKVAPTVSNQYSIPKVLFVNSLQSACGGQGIFELRKARLKVKYSDEAGAS